VNSRDPSVGKDVDKSAASDHLRGVRSSAIGRAGILCLASAILGYAVGFGFFMFSANLFIEPMRTEFGWSSTEATFLPISALVLALMFPISGKMADKWGPRRLALGGLLGFAACFLLMATLPLTVGLGRTVAVGFGICCAAAGPISFSRAVVSWFPDNAGFALGLTGSGATIGGVIGVPFNAMLIAEYGWRSAYLGMAALVLLIGLPLVAAYLGVRNAEAQKSPHIPNDRSRSSSGGGVKSLPIGDARFWLLGFALTCCCLSIGIYLNHLQPILKESGLPLQSTALLGSIFAASTFGGRIAAGFLLDRMSPLLVAIGCLTFAAIGAAIVPLAPGLGLPFFGVALALVGLAYGAEADFAAYFSLRFFGIERFSFTFGTLAMMIALALAIGGFATARSVDSFGNYEIAVLFGPAGFAVAAITMLILTRVTVPDGSRTRPV
jgi:MFS family permease